MKKDIAKNIVESALNDKFSLENFYSFISNLFKTAILFDTPESIDIKEQFKAVISDCFKIGSYIDDEKNQIDIFKVELSSDHSIDKARTTQRNFISHCLKQSSADAAAVAFVTPNANDWRFSLVKLEYVVAVENEKIINKDEVTPAKRWSFLVGKNEGCHTAISRFVPILESNIKPNLIEIENAFNIEQVTDEFYKKYKELFLKVKEELDALISNDQIIKDDFNFKGIKTEDFAKKTIGQLAFIYFLQKKGWLGVDAKKEWGTGPKNFLRDIFVNRKQFGKNFFNDILEPLFYKGLAQDRGRDSIFPELNNCRIPFLNGGLFEPMNGYSWETTDIVFKDELFSNENITPEGDVGSGILDIFDRYNFTVHESEPLEKEVAVDPEMLGKVFENLLNVKDRKDKGAFYTPREIVHFICQESLVNYLFNANIVGLEIERIRLFIFSGITEGLLEYAQYIDELLKNVKICDPAVGSGAFPLGMLNEIVKARQNLNAILNNQVSKYELKFDAISNSLYGVDLDPGAIEIAKLRMWLSLAVDEGLPSPLPNLDNKLIQGNSLISKYKGIEIFSEQFFNEIQLKLDRQSIIKEKINDLQSEYVDLHNKNKLDSAKKADLDKQLILYKKKLSTISNVKNEETLQLFSEDEENKIARVKINSLKEKVKSYLIETSKSKKEDLKFQIDNLKWDLIELSLTDNPNLEHLKQIKELREKNEKPFFIWELEFNEVFNENGGFDIIIGNPPYVQIQKFSGSQTQKNLENENYDTFTKYGDLYCLFYERGISILREGGVLIFITSNKWMRAGYGEKTREFFLKNNPLFLINLGPNIFDSATVDTCILEIQRRKNLNEFKALDLNGQSKISPNLFVATYKNAISIPSLSSAPWSISNENEFSIKNKVETLGKPLKDLNLVIYRGIITGLNEAFIINKDTKDFLIKENGGKEIDIIKPILRGRDTRKFTFEFNNLYVIVTKFGSYKTLEKDYPVIFKYLTKFKDKLQKRGQCKGTRTGRRMSEEYSGQHHWLELDNNLSDQYLNLFKNEKIIFQEIVRSPQFYLDTEGIYYAEATAFFITGENLLYITGLLNSNTVTYLFKNFYSGGGLGSSGYRYKKKFIELIPIPNYLDNIEIAKEIERIVDLIQINKSKKNNTMELESELDNLVYKVYKLSNDEIQIIENSFKNYA